MVKQKNLVDLNKEEKLRNFNPKNMVENIALDQKGYASNASVKELLIAKVIVDCKANGCEHPLKCAENAAKEYEELLKIVEKPTRASNKTSLKQDIAFSIAKRNTVKFHTQNKQQDTENNK